jgi:hypothetical protein
MKRFLIFALVGAFGVAGGTGLAFGKDDHSKPGSKPQATKTSPTPTPGKHPPSKPQTEPKKPVPPVHRPVDRGNKSGNGRIVEKGVSKSGQRSPDHKDPAKPGKGSKPGAGDYTWDDYVRDLDKATKEEMAGQQEELVPDFAVAGGAIGGAAGGPAGVALGAGGAAIANAPQLIDAKAKEAKGLWDGVSATGKFIWSGLNDMSKSNPRPKSAPVGTRK